MAVCMGLLGFPIFAIGYGTGIPERKSGDIRSTSTLGSHRWSTWGLANLLRAHDCCSGQAEPSGKPRHVQGMNHGLVEAAVGSVVGHGFHKHPRSNSLFWARVSSGMHEWQQLPQPIHTRDPQGWQQLVWLLGCAIGWLLTISWACGPLYLTVEQLGTCCCSDQNRYPSLSFPSFLRDRGFFPVFQALWPYLSSLACLLAFVLWRRSIFVTAAQHPTEVTIWQWWQWWSRH